MSYSSNDNWQKVFFVIAIGVMILLAGYAIGFVITAIGAAFGLANDIGNRGVQEVVGPDSWSYMLIRLAIVVGSWVIGIGIGVVVVRTFVPAVEKVAEGVKRKPMVTFAAMLGFLAWLVADICKDSLPSGDAWAKGVLKFGSALLFAVAGWLYDSTHFRFRMAGVSLWIAFPLVFLVCVVLTPREPQDRGITDIPFQAWTFAGIWVCFAFAALLLARQVKKEEDRSDWAMPPSEAE